MTWCRHLLSSSISAEKFTLVLVIDNCNLIDAFLFDMKSMSRKVPLEPFY